MRNDQGYNYLFNFIFHEVMEIHPDVRKAIENKAVRRYVNLTPSQQNAVDEVFGSLFRQSFSECFSISANNGVLDVERMIFSVKYSNKNALPPLKQSHSH